MNKVDIEVFAQVPWYGRAVSAEVDEAATKKDSIDSGVIRHMAGVGLSVVEAVTGVFLLPLARRALVVDVVSVCELATSPHPRALVGEARVMPILVESDDLVDEHGEDEFAFLSVLGGPRSDYPVADLCMLSDVALTCRQ